MRKHNHNDKTVHLGGKKKEDRNESTCIKKQNAQKEGSSRTSFNDPEIGQPRETAEAVGKRILQT